MIFEEFPGDGIDTIFLILSGKKRVRKRFESYNKMENFCLFQAVVNSLQISVHSSTDGVIYMSVVDFKLNDLMLIWQIGILNWLSRPN